MAKNEIQKQGRIVMLPVDCIEPSPYQARTAFDEPEIAALAVSILQNGLLQPISVRRVGLRKYQLIAGERRLRACRLAKLEKVPAIVADYDDSESAALGLLENLQRSQLDPFDTARGIKEVIRLWGCTQAEAARRLGLSQPALANKLRLLTLTPEQQQLCTANHLTERHARAALRLPESRRTPALEKMARDKLSVRQADKLVDQMLAAPNGPSPCRRTIPMVRDVRFFVNTLQHAVDLMTQKGIQATTRCDKHDGCLEYIVRILVSSDGTAGKVENGAKEEEGEFEVKVCGAGFLRGCRAGWAALVYTFGLPRGRGRACPARGFPISARLPYTSAIFYHAATANVSGTVKDHSLQSIREPHL